MRDDSVLGDRDCCECRDTIMALEQEIKKQEAEVTRLLHREAELEGWVESLRNRLAAKDEGYPVRGKRNA